MLGRLFRNSGVLRASLGTLGSQPALLGNVRVSNVGVSPYSSVPPTIPSTTTLQVTGDRNLKIKHNQTGNTLNVAGASFLELKAPESEVGNNSSLVHKILGRLDDAYSARATSCGKYLFADKAMSSEGLSNKWAPALRKNMHGFTMPPKFNDHFREKIQVFDEEATQELHQLFFKPQLGVSDGEGPIRRVEIKRVVASEDLTPALDLVRDMITDHGGAIRRREGGPADNVNKTSTTLGGNVYFVDDLDNGGKNHGKLRRRVYAHPDETGGWVQDPETNGRAWLEFKAKNVALSEHFGGNMCQKPRYLVSDSLFEDYVANPSAATIAALFEDAATYSENKGKVGEGESLKRLLLRMEEGSLYFDPRHTVTVQRESFFRGVPEGSQ